MRLSDTINRKFTDVIELSDWLIDTPTGWKDCTHLNQTIEYEIYEIKFESGNSIKVADTHIFIDITGQEIFAKDCINSYIQTRHGADRIVDITKTGVFENMYDVTVDSEDHLFYSNDVVSHNTTTVASYILHYILFSDGVPTVAIVGHKAAGAREVMQRLQLMYEYLPKWMQKGVKTWNKGNIILEGEQGADGAQVFTGATTAAGLRSKSVSLLYIDECAIIPNTIADEFFASTYPTISSGERTKIIITSTPKGYNHFWHFWSKAEATGKEWNGFVQVRAEWHEHPKHGEKWYNEQLALLGQLKFNQEVLMNFLGSSATLIDSSAISKLFAKGYTYEKDGLDIIYQPVKGHSYIMTVDPSKGVGGDYSTFSVIDVTTLPYVQVAKYRNNTISPMLLPSVISRMAKEYNDAFVLIESNVSEQIAYILYHEIGYENILMVGRGKTGQYVTNGFRDSQMGVQMDKKVKSIGCNNLKILVEEGKLLVHDADTISEISTFIDNGKGTYAADDGYNDDLMMTLVMFGWLTTQNYFKDLNDIDLRARIYRERMEEIENSMLPSGFLCDGSETEDDRAFLELLR